MGYLTPADRYDTMDLKIYTDKVEDAAHRQIMQLLAQKPFAKAKVRIMPDVHAGKGCVIGNSTEIKNAVLFDNVAAPHYNYIGDSIVGNFAHLGAGVILSNLKSYKSNITVKGVKSYPTCLRKMGAIIGERAEIGCGCVLNPGTVIGKNSTVYPLTSVRGVVPACSIVKSNTKTVPKI